ncbi:MAG: RNA-binding domain-containing protein, partial [Oligosphaeraceae bacterium]
MDGFTYIKNVLESDGRDVDKLLFKLCKRENSAVEFKASFLPKKGSGDNADACSWNVVSDVIAIANSAGGCILLGIDNDGEYASDFTSGLSLDEYTRRLHDHLSNKKEWVFDQKKYTVAQKYRDRLKDCLTVLEGFAYGKDILVIHIKPSNKPIVYEETKLKGNNPPSEYLTHRSKGAIAQKNQIPLSAEAIEEFLERETSSPYFDQLWDEYSGNQRVQKQNLWIAFISVFFAILTMTQCYLVYNNTTTATEFIFLLSSIPILFLANVLLVFIFHATRKIILYFLTLGWISFSISSVFFALRLFSATNDSVA